MSNSSPNALQNISTLPVGTQCYSACLNDRVLAPSGSTLRQRALVLVLAVDTVLNQLCSPTGAVGRPLPGVEVRIALSNSSNTTIAEGNHKDTQVNDENTWRAGDSVCFVRPSLDFFFFFWLPLILFSFNHLILILSF